MNPAEALTHTGIHLQGDPTRVVTKFFVAGQEDVNPGDSRAAPVIQRVLELSESDVAAALVDLDERFLSRHVALHDTFRDHAAMLTSRLDGASDISPARALLLGASFTNEFAIEGAALCNPSAVLAPVQDDSSDAQFVMSVRSIGEGHRSSVGFRTGRLSAAGAVTVDDPSPFPILAAATPALNHRAVFHAHLAALGGELESTMFVLDELPDRFDDVQLRQRFAALTADDATRTHVDEIIGRMRALSKSSYTVEFPQASDLSERVLWPQSPAESHGMEDARFVRFTRDDGSVTYFGTYTAYDGFGIAQHLLDTDDFRSFGVSPMAGPAAIGKGLALFPRKIAGRYVALSRSDRETNAIAFSDDLHCWNTSEVIQTPCHPWEIIQLGNCGSPIETDAGWLVLTHGVGAMRTYSIGALLLDIDHPEQVLAHSAQPLLAPAEGHRDGYVPNVVYSCGGFAHGDTLLLPYGIADQSIGVATVSISLLLASLTRG